MGLTTILLPGMDGTGTLLAPFLEALPRSVAATVVAYPTQTIMGYAELQPLVEARLPTDRPFAIVAESFSGPLAIRIAARRPAGLEALVLVGSFVASPLPPSRSWLRAMNRPLLFRRAPPAFLVRAFLAGADAPEELVALFHAAWRSVDPAVLSARLGEILSVDATRELAQSALPVLCVSGGRDRLVTQAVTRRMTALRPDAETAVLDAPHLILQRCAAPAARVIADFLERIYAGVHRGGSGAPVAV